METQNNIALLIDAENISKKYIKLIMNELSEYGVVTYKRVYGDFSNPNVSTWKSSIVEFAMTPVFQFNYTKRKNASDSAMVIDAMDILYSGKVSGFCLVTSDSDFTKLAIRLREAGMLVVGMGEQKTPGALVSACETFKYLDLLYKDEGGEIASDVLVEKEITSAVSKSDNIVELPENDNEKNKSDSDTCGENSIPSQKEIEEEICAILNTRTNEDGWANLASIGGMLSKRVPGFDPRNYGYKKLKDFVESLDCFDIQEIPHSGNELLKKVYIKEK